MTKLLLQSAVVVLISHLVKCTLHSYYLPEAIGMPPPPLPLDSPPPLHPHISLPHHPSPPDLTSPYAESSSPVKQKECALIVPGGKHAPPTHKPLGPGLQYINNYLMRWVTAFCERFGSQVSNEKINSKWWMMIQWVYRLSLAWSCRLTWAASFNCMLNMKETTKSACPPVVRRVSKWRRRRTGARVVKHPSHLLIFLPSYRQLSSQFTTSVTVTTTAVTDAGRREGERQRMRN